MDMADEFSEEDYCCVWACLDRFHNLRFLFMVFLLVNYDGDLIRLRALDTRKTCPRGYCGSSYYGGNM